jgi:hypothetical protein
MKMNKMKTRYGDRIGQLFGFVLLAGMMLTVAGKVKGEKSAETHEPEIKAMASFGGVIRGPVAIGKYLLFGQRDTIRVIDGSDVGRRREVAQLQLDGAIQKIWQVGNALYAMIQPYGSSFKAICVIDIKDPLNLSIEDEIRGGGDIYICGTHLKCAEREEKPVYYNIANPMKPEEEELSETQEESIFTKKSKPAGTQESFKIECLRSDSLKTKLQQASEIEIEHERAYVLNGSRELVVLDLAVRAKPRWLGTYALKDESYGLAVRGKRIFVFNKRERAIDIYDIATQQIRLLASHKIDDDSGDIDGNQQFGFARIHGKTDNLGIFDYSSQSDMYPAPAFMKGLDCNEFMLIGSIGYFSVGSSFYAVDFTNPSKAKMLDQYMLMNQMHDEYTYINRGVAVGKRIYTLGARDGDDCARAFDVSDPQRIRLLSECNVVWSRGGPYAASETSFYMIEKVGYAGGTCYYLHYLDYADAQHPTFIEAQESCGLDSPKDMAALGDWIYVADDDGLAIFKVCR